jgi:histidinol dehydrogenase
MRMLEGQIADTYVKNLEHRGSRYDEIEPAVSKIVDDVRRNGDAALLKYARQFDGLDPAKPVRVCESEMKEAWKRTPAQLQTALRKATKNIRQFCEWQKPRAWRKSQAGTSLGQLVRPLDSVGCYVPGGRFPLVSTLLMTVIPAQVAGVKSIRVVSPRPSSEVMAAAAMLGAGEFYRVGGAQAIASLAYGTETIPRVTKIVGPGNLYVTAAKKLVAFDCSIDMLAGPTEVVIVSEKGKPAFIAADLVAQAEHDPETLAVFVTTSRGLAEAVSKQLDGADWLRENVIAQESLEARGAILVADSREQAFDWANRIAPEHITIGKKDLSLVQNAGSVFIGDYSAQAAGDYASGPNHVLPTAGAARFRGGLSVMDFLKVISVQELSSTSLRKLSPTIVRLAETEGLRAHAESVRVRRARA